MTHSVVGVRNDVVAETGETDTRSVAAKVSDFLTEFEDKVVDRTKVNDLMENLEKFEGALVASQRSLTQKFESDFDALPNEYSVEAKYKDSSGTVMWIGFGLWVVLVWAQFSQNGFLSGVLSAIGFGIAIFIATMIIGLLVGRTDKSRQDSETEVLRSKVRHDRSQLQKEFDKERDEHQEALRMITQMRTRTHQDMKNDLAYRIQRSHELASTLNYDGEIAVDADNRETKGKPLLKWRSEALEINDSDVQALVEQDNLDPTSIGGGRLLPFFQDGVAGEIKIYSSTGGMLKDGIGQQATLLHHVDPEDHGEFLDEAPAAGSTVNYYIVLETQFLAVIPAGKNRYKAEDQHHEHIITKRRVTVPRFLDEAERLEQEIAENTTELKRRKYQEQYEKTLRKMSGDSTDPDQALKEVLEKANSRRERERKKQEYVAQIEAELTAAGASEEEVEEAIEEFYKSMEA